VRQRIALWGALAVIAVGAGGLVVALGGGGSGDGGAPPDLPLALGATDGRAEAATPSAAADIAVPGGYVPGDGLPALGGHRTAYRLQASIDADDVRQVAKAVGIDAAPTEKGDSWHAEKGPMALDVYGPDGSWSAYRMMPVEGTGSSAGSTGSVGSGSTGSGSAGPPPEVLGTTPPVPVGPAIECPDTKSGVAANQPGVETGSATSCVPTCATYPPDDAVHDGVQIQPCRLPVETVPPPTTTVPADLPSQDEARRIALDVLDASGADTHGAQVTTEDLGGLWSVTVEPVVDGVPAPGLDLYVTIGAEGRIDSASGHLGKVEELGDYPLIDTKAAITRLNEGWALGGAASDVAVSAAAEAAPPKPAADVTAAPRTPGGSDDASGAATSGPAAGTTGGADRPGTGPPTVAGTDDPAATGGSAAAGGNGTGGSTPATSRPAIGPAVGGSGGAAGPGTGPPTVAGTDDPAVSGPAAGVGEVAVTHAERVLVLVPSWDGSGSYLVPGYRFTADDGSAPTVPAVKDDVLKPPPAPSTTVPPTGGKPEPGQIDPAPPVGKPEPGQIDPAPPKDQAEMGMVTRP
jgi:hypothetical protein